MRKGFLGKFIFTIVMLGLFSLAYIAMDQVYDPFLTFAEAQSTDADSLEKISIVDIMWVYIPMAVLFSFLVWAIEFPRKEREVFR
jgi:hypothetical protein